MDVSVPAFGNRETPLWKSGHLCDCTTGSQGVLVARDETRKATGIRCKRVGVSPGGKLVVSR